MITNTDFCSFGSFAAHIVPINIDAGNQNLEFPVFVWLKSLINISGEHFAVTKQKLSRRMQV